jgi:hypothetical protein
LLLDLGRDDEGVTMNLRWKFWRRSANKRPAEPATPAAQPPTQPPIAGWGPLYSARELLGLQRVVGNQAVLELLAIRKASSASGEKRD